MISLSLSTTLPRILNPIATYRIYIVSAVILIIFGFTILDVQKVGVNLTNQTLVQEKRQEILAEKVNFDETVIDDIVGRTSGSSVPVAPPPVTNNPFTYGN